MFLDLQIHLKRLMLCFSEMEEFFDLDALKKERERKRKKNNAKISGHLSNRLPNVACKSSALGPQLFSIFINHLSSIW